MQRTSSSNCSSNKKIECSDLHNIVNATSGVTVVSGMIKPKYLQNGNITYNLRLVWTANDLICCKLHVVRVQAAAHTAKTLQNSSHTPNQHSYRLPRSYRCYVVRADHGSATCACEHSCASTQVLQISSAESLGAGCSSSHETRVDACIAHDCEVPRQDVDAGCERWGRDEDAALKAAVPARWDVSRCC